eukprot:8214746-Pyramimonas_sp.AAC.1
MTTTKYQTTTLRACVHRKRIFAACVHRRRRVPVTVLHYRTLCRRCCRGARTLQRAWEIVAYYYRVCLDGQWPRADFLGNPWPPGSVRSKLAGKPLFECQGVRFHGVLTEISADLDEFAK